MEHLLTLSPSLSHGNLPFFRTIELTGGLLPKNSTIILTFARSLRWWSPEALLSLPQSGKTFGAKIFPIAPLLPEGGAEE